MPWNQRLGLQIPKEGLLGPSVLQQVLSLVVRAHVCPPAAALTWIQAVLVVRLLNTNVNKLNLRLLRQERRFKLILFTFKLTKQHMFKWLVNSNKTSKSRWQTNLVFEVMGWPTKIPNLNVPYPIRLVRCIIAGSFACLMIITYHLIIFMHPINVSVPYWGSMDIYFFSLFAICTL